MRPGYYAAFLYGVNIPGGVQISFGELQLKLKGLPPELHYSDYVGDVDDLIFESSSVVHDEQSLRQFLHQSLHVNSVVLSSLILCKVLSDAKQYLASIRCPLVRGYRLIRNDQEWEIGVVLSSEAFPSSMQTGKQLFQPRKNAIALCVLEGRGVLVEKRCRTEGGKQSRITWGSTVNRPVESLLRRNGNWVEHQCLTSRALGTIERIVSRMASLAT